MELKGKTINFLGDSITEGAGTSGPEKIYPAVIARNEGLKVARNYGIGGTRIARQTGKSAEEKFDLDFCMRVDEMDPHADAVVVFGGTNDWGHGDAFLGCMNDRTPWTFYGALHFLYARLYERYPESEIVVATPLHRVGEENPGRRRERHPAVHPPLSTYVEIIREVARYYALPVLDLYATSGIQPNLAACRERYCPDGLHPNDAGHAILARKIAAFLKCL